MKTVKATTQPKAQNTSKKQNASKVCRPRRPLNAYNMFFAIERHNIIRKQQEGEFIPETRVSSSPGIERAHVGFANLARIVSERWKTIDPNMKGALQEKARLDKIRYQREMKEWKLLQKLNQEFDIMKSQAKLDVERMKHTNNVFDRTISWTRQVSDGKSSSTDCDSPIASRKEAIDFFRETSSLPHMQSQDRGAFCKEAFEFVNGASGFSHVQRQDYEASFAPDLFCVPCSSPSPPCDIKSADNDLRDTHNPGVNMSAFDYNGPPSRRGLFSTLSSDPFHLDWSPSQAFIPLAATSMDTVEMLRTSPTWNDQCHNCGVSSPPGVGLSIYGLDDCH